MGLHACTPMYACTQNVDHVCNLSIHGQHLFLPQTCSRHGRSRIYELSWHCTWLVEILDPGSSYISIYVFSIFADATTAAEQALQQLPEPWAPDRKFSTQS